MPDNELTGDQIASVPPASPITTKSGLLTSSGQFTAIFTLAALLLSFAGLHYSSEQIENWFVVINNVIITLGPLIAIVPVIMNYVNSRGKIASNAITSQASMVAAQSQGAIAPIMGQATLIGGPNWKDPHTYEQILDIAKAVGVPIPASVDRINQELHPADLIQSIWGLLKHKP